MRAMVVKWGDGAAVHIPSAVMDALALRLDQPVDVRAEEGRIVIERVEPTADAATPRYRLEDLLATITDDNLHEEIDFGPPVGREIL